MKIGVCLPYMKREWRRESLLAWCRQLDHGPFHCLSCGERVTGHSVDMRVSLAAAAAATERIGIMPSLYVLPMHRAAQVAKEVATLDWLSNGRVTLCVGVGGREADYRAVGAPFSRRHQRMDEQVAEIRRLWSGAAPFDGADPIGPEPVQPGGPPILIGAMGPKGMARGARWADGVYAFSMNGERDEMRGMLERWRRAWDAAGRDGPTRLVGGFWYSLAPNAAEALSAYVYEYLKIAGDALARELAAAMTRHGDDAVLEAMDAMEDAGCDELFMVPATAERAELDGIERLVARRGWGR